jgi:hypothetical protein
MKIHICALAALASLVALAPTETLGAVSRIRITLEQTHQNPFSAAYRIGNIDANDFVPVLVHCGFFNLTSVSPLRGVGSEKVEIIGENVISQPVDTEINAIRIANCFNEGKNGTRLRINFISGPGNDFKIVHAVPEFYYTEEPAVTTEDGCPVPVNSTVMHFDVHTTSSRKITSAKWSNKRQYLAWRIRRAISDKCNIDICSIYLRGAADLCIVDSTAFQIEVDPDVSEDIRTCIDDKFVKAAHNRLQNAYEVSVPHTGCFNQTMTR